jgi:hypothetical protein
MEMEHKFLVNRKNCGFKNKITIFLILTLFCVRYSYGTNISVWPKEIKFNYESGSSNDALTIKSYYGGPITVPEWNNSGRNEKFAYIKSQTNRKIKVRFDSNCSSPCDSMHLLINLTVTSGNGIGSICNYFIENYNKNDEVLLPLDGTIPNSVGIQTFTWSWQIYAIPYDIAYCSALSSNNTIHIYYTLYSTPLSPMEYPWTSVLDTACDWASGQSTNSNIISILTNTLYLGSGLYYNPRITHYDPDTWPNPSKYEFDLTNFLYEWHDADCQDCSMFLTILCSSIGSTLNQTRRIQGLFWTKSLLPIGWSSNDWTEVNDTTWWSFHQVAWLNNVYDPTIELNPSNPYIPINKNIDNPYKVDLFDSGSWSPKNPFRLREMDPYFNVPSGIK